ncbi:unnamed protein product [Prorocentrum cordatum]|uniref:C3H1-type domain-containing protein n=1 Tax=Prorocentrum cordatum TaxID=2364126 RepID=A0ABN9PBI8_9DINO|nr:unnamed protein product [Polarella glacialis]
MSPRRAVDEMCPASPAVSGKQPQQGRAGAAAGPTRAPRRASSQDLAARSLFKKTTLCRFYTLRRGCERGSSCPFAHGEEEVRSKPDLTKTSLCKLWAQGRCPHESWQCPWAHGACELQRVRLEARKPDPGDVALTGGPSEAGSKDQCGVRLGDLADDRASSSGLSRGDAVDVLLDALAGGGGSSAGEEKTGKRQGAPDTQKQRSRFCVQCGASGHSPAASFCVQCGCALAECSSAATSSPQGGCAGGTPAAAGVPVVFGDPAAAMLGPWPMGVCAAPGTVMLVPAASQGWMVAPPAAQIVALGDVSPAAGGMVGYGLCQFAVEPGSAPA